jgi:hypothetical protein
MHQMVKYAVEIDSEGLSYAIAELTAFREETLGGEPFLVGKARPVAFWSAGWKDAAVPSGIPVSERFPREHCLDTLAEAYSFLEEHKGSLVEGIKDRTRRAGREIKECNRHIRAKRAEIRELWHALKYLATLDIDREP